MMTLEISILNGSLETICYKLLFESLYMAHWLPRIIYLTMKELYELLNQLKYSSLVTMNELYELDIYG